ncbi:DUF3095 domain-containing protein [Gellertiella hungarica]|uniref:Adenylate cyclase n=1 Tax=Gellertiella hungarica TaxID=1572859 RepID=A0A7W6J1X1_9HYPH|nr:DUF3095 domain-containing protein [Gellertiella hungarica]MBB4063255.1 hypothetical protein [Gellertiella hungarica]
MEIRQSTSFFSTLPVFEDFDGVTRDENYTPLPPDWWLAVADIVDSTKAIEAGRYKAVNMAGASVISAVMNAAGEHDLPFVFGGDGAAVAIPPSAADAARRALASTRAWVRENMQLTLRVALVPLCDIRAAGHDVRVGRFRASEQVSYAMFSGGGAHWAERRMKEGAYGIDESLSLGPPDLSGLSCRWNPVRSRNGVIASIIALPRPGADEAAFRRLVRDVVAEAGSGERDGHPLPREGPPVSLSPGACRVEVRAAPPGLPRLKKMMRVAFEVTMISLLSAFNGKAGSFDARRYREDVSANSDFRKYDDGLKMTVDIDQHRLERIRRRLEEAEQAGICQFGIHVQETALVTCLVPTPLSRDHMHFIDGGSGGYAMAASRLKKNLAA